MANKKFTEQEMLTLRNSKYGSDIPVIVSFQKRIAFFFYKEGSYEGILKSGIEVKVSSGKCLAKCAAVARGKDTYF